MGLYDRDYMRSNYRSREEHDQKSGPHIPIWLIVIALIIIFFFLLCLW